MTPNYAEVFTSGNSYVVRYCSGPEKARIVGLFGTDTLPTAYCLPMTMAEVMAELRPRHANVCLVEACSLEEQQRRAAEPMPEEEYA